MEIIKCAAANVPDSVDHDAQRESRPSQNECDKECCRDTREVALREHRDESPDANRATADQGDGTCHLCCKQIATTCLLLLVPIESSVKITLGRRLKEM